jgi:hypothetical protein
VRRQKGENCFSLLPFPFSLVERQDQAGLALATC